MALIFLDSCQDYTDPKYKYDDPGNASIVTTGGRTQPYYIQPGAGSPTANFGACRRFGVNRTNAIVGWAFMNGTSNGFTGTGYNAILRFCDSSFSGTWNDAEQCTLYYAANGYFQLQRGSTVLATSTSPTANDNNWHYIECSIVINATTGSIVLHVDGATVLNATGLNTQATANTQWNSIKLGGSTWSVYYSGDVRACDIYVLDSSGSAPWNTFLGNTKVYFTAATANGSTNNFTPQAAAWAASTAYALNAVIVDSNGNIQLVTTAGTSGSGSHPTWATTTGATTTDGGATWTCKGTPANYKYIANVPPNDTQSYLSDSTLNDVELYSFGALTSTTGVTAAAVNIRGYRDQTTTRAVRGLCKSGATTADSGSDVTIPNGVANQIDFITFFPTDPNTSAQWTISNLNAAQFGVKISV